jgi:transcriptional regulator with XRE-family HTH domain
MTFGKKLKSFRLEKNMSQQDLAEKLNVTPQAVSKWENDISEPEFQIITEITQIYKVSFDRLFQDDKKNIYKGLILNVVKDSRMGGIYSFLFLSLIIITIYTYTLDELTIYFPLSSGSVGVITGVLLIHFSRLRDDYQKTPNCVLDIYGDRIVFLIDEVVIPINEEISLIFKKYNIFEDIGSIRIRTEDKKYIIRNIKGISQIRTILSDIQYINLNGEKL